MNISEKGVTFGCNFDPQKSKVIEVESGDPYGTRSRLKAFGNLRVDSPKRLNQSVLIRRTKKP